MTEDEAIELLELIYEDRAAGSSEDVTRAPELDGTGVDDLLADDLVLGALPKRRQCAGISPEHLAALDAMKEICDGFGEKVPPFRLYPARTPAGAALARLMRATCARFGLWTRPSWVAATEAQRTDARWLALKLDELDYERAERRAIQEGS